MWSKHKNNKKEKKFPYFPLIDFPLKIYNNIKTLVSLNTSLYTAEVQSY